MKKLIRICAAWDYSAWVRTYALFLEERLECCRVLKYDVEAERTAVRFCLPTMDDFAWRKLMYSILRFRKEAITTVHMVFSIFVDSLISCVLRTIHLL